MKQGWFSHLIIVLCLTVFLSSCSDKQVSLAPLEQDAVILAFGDSLTYGTGVNSKTQSYPAILRQLTGLNVINRGIPGEVSAYGFERLEDVLQETKPSLVILCHGGNDIIRKRGKEQLKTNLGKMIEMIQSKGIDVVLIGVPNFNLMLSVLDLYPDLATQYKLPIELSILATLERNPQMKSDHIHPNAKGYRAMAESIYDLLKSAGALN